MTCDGTGCMNEATKNVCVRVLLPLGLVYRDYCDDCTEKARKRTMSEVVSVQALPSQSRDAT